MLDFNVSILLAPNFIGNKFTNEYVSGGVIYDIHGNIVDWKFELIE